METSNKIGLSVVGASAALFAAIVLYPKMRTSEESKAVDKPTDIIPAQIDMTLNSFERLTEMQKKEAKYYVKWNAEVVEVYNANVIMLKVESGTEKTWSGAEKKTYKKLLVSYFTNKCSFPIADLNKGDTITVAGYLKDIKPGLNVVKDKEDNVYLCDLHVYQGTISDRYK